MHAYISEKMAKLHLKSASIINNSLNQLHRRIFIILVYYTVKKLCTNTTEQILIVLSNYKWSPNRGCL